MSNDCGYYIAGLCALSEDGKVEYCRKNYDERLICGLGKSYDRMLLVNRKDTRLEEISKQ